tara:strand:+ start:38162 stop:39451 length:1290 start_codon:yes stop_codon:yes gene_type:complete
LEDAWSQTKKELQKSAKDSNVRQCLQSLRPVPLKKDSSGDRMILELEDANLLDIANQLQGPIQSRLSSITEKQVRVEFRLKSKSGRRESSWVREKLDLERFCEGQSNRIALMAARNVLQQPGKVNPLLIFGETGTGKSHLLNAIAHETLKSRPETKCTLIRMDEFPSHFGEQLQKRRNLTLKNRFRRGDMLFIEDFHTIRGASPNVLDELYFIFNSYYENGRQIVVTSDIPIKELSITSRWLSRFLSGLQVKLEAPDTDLRKRILKQKIQDIGLHLGNESIGRILDRIRGNARDIESAINRLYFLQSSGMELTDHLLEQQLEEFISPGIDGPLNPQLILDTIVDICGVTREEILGNSRKMEIALPRHLAMYLAVHHSDLNKSAVARFFRRTDHSTVIHAERKIAMKLQKEPSFQHLHRQVMERLGINRG